jgi:membrane protein
MDIARILAKVLDQPQVARVMRVLDIYGHAAGGLLANGLAFSALFAAIPAALLVVGVGGFVASGNAEARDRLVQALIDAFPPLADLINGAVSAVSQGAALTSIIGFVGVIWTVSQFYGAIDVAFARIFAESQERDIVRRTARGFVVVALIGILIVAFVVLVSFASYIDALVPTQMPVATAVVTVLRSALFLMALAIVTVLAGYRFLPPSAPRWRSALIPAIVVGIAIVILSQIFMLLVPRLVGVAALAGSLASAFIALAWLSFTFQAILYGAAWVRVRDELADREQAAESADLRSPAAAAEPGGRGE